MDDIDLFMAQGGGSGSSDASFAADTNFTNLDDGALISGAYPLVSDQTHSGNADTLNKLGSAISDPNLARNLGSAVGSIEKQIQGFSGQFNAAKNATATGNSLSTWWMYASTTDKLMVGLAVLGIVVVLVKE